MVGFSVRALLSCSATLVISGANSQLLAQATSQHGASTAPVEAAVGDAMRRGISGKLRGPLFSYLAKRPFEAKVNGRIGQYLIGFWPGERRRVTTVAYQNPAGFIEVTQEN